MNGNLIDMINCMAALPGAAASLGWFVSFDPIRLILQIRRLIFLFFFKIDARRVVKKSKKIEFNFYFFDLTHFRIYIYIYTVYGVKRECGTTDKGFKTPNSVRSSVRFYTNDHAWMEAKVEKTLLLLLHGGKTLRGSNEQALALCCKQT